jgi:hypothetical protein
MIPKIKDIYEVANIEKSDALMVLLNQPPKKEWICDHPFIKVDTIIEGAKVKVPYKYLPIERVEYLLKSIFKRYRIVITGQGTAFNGVWVTVRVEFFHPIFNEWDYHDGIGALQLQTAKGTSPADLSNINSGALTMAFPHAKTLAIKDACDHFGKLFGSDLNRKDVINYEQDMTLIPFDQKHPNWQKACDAVAQGVFTADQINVKYTMTDEILQILKGYEPV